MTSGLAMRMRLELSQLARRHKIAPASPCALPLAEPTAYPVNVTGIAVSGSVDRERMRFRAYCPTFLPWSPPLLLFRHKDPAGEILAIWHDARGRLVVDARVDRPEARRANGLSVCATIEQYELRDVDDPANFHALITRAQVDEISLTPSPACRDCVVTSRVTDYQPGRLFDLAQQGFAKAAEIVELLQKVNTRSRAMPAALPRARMARPPTPFGQLVAQLKEMES